MRPVTVNLPNHTAGDTWEGITVGPIVVNGSTPALEGWGTLNNGAGIKMSFRSKHDRTLGQTLTDSDCSSINITTWAFTVDPLVFSMAAGNYEWDLELTGTDGVIRTTHKGSFNLVQDVSQ